MFPFVALIEPILKWLAVIFLANIVLRVIVAHFKFGKD